MERDNSFPISGVDWPYMHTYMCACVDVCMYVYIMLFSVLRSEIWFSRENSGLEHAEGQVLNSDRNMAKLHFDNPVHLQPFYRTLDVSDTLETVIHHLRTVVHLSVLCLTDKLSRCQTNFFSFHLKALCHLGLVNIESILFTFSPSIQRPCFWEHCAAIYCVLNRAF